MNERHTTPGHPLIAALVVGVLALGALDLAQRRGAPGPAHSESPAAELGSAESHASAPSAAHESGAARESKHEDARESKHEDARALSPEGSRSLMRIEPGFVAELVCAEPLIEAPVAMSFDADGRLWVVEMRGYMPNNDATGEREPSGRISILDDRDGDGFYETVTVFMDKLVLPRGVLPIKGGALVLAPPDLFIAHDDNADGVCDRTISVMHDLGGIENPEHAPNGLLLGLDNWIEFSQHDKAFRLRGDAIDIRMVTHHGQWGISKDDLGRLYYVPNSDALRADLLPKQYFARNREQSREGVTYELVQPDPTVWPIRPTLGVNRGYMKGILRPDGRLATHTAACAPTIYREHAFGPEYVGSAFVCEPAAYLIKRHILEDHDGVVVARHATPGREFLASLDERFRPVNSCVGPDGSLYIADMYRGVIQHKTYLTPYLKDYIKKHDLESPLNCGRIWRIRRQDTPRPARVKMSEMSTPALAGLLESSDGWWRDMAQTLLVDRADAGAAVEARRVLESSPMPLARLHALWTLEGIAFETRARMQTRDENPSADTKKETGPGAAGLSEIDIARACSDADPNVVAAGLRLMVEHTSKQTTPEQIAAFDLLSAHASVIVRRQAALSLPYLGIGKQAQVERLTRMILRDAGDRLMRVAVVDSAAGMERDLLASLLSSSTFGVSVASSRVLRSLGECMVRRNDATRTQLAELVAGLAQADDERCAPLVGVLQSAQKLREKNPVTLKLDREPSGWRDAMSRAGRYTSKIEASDPFLTWKGRANQPIARELTDREQALFDRGRTLFVVCAACHGNEAQGVPGSIPALVGSSRVLGRADTMAKILLHGLEGPLDTGEPTNASMPAAPIKSDDDLAAVMTFVRRSWGNNAPPVPPELVRDVRKANAGRAMSWTRKELDEH